MNTEVPDAPKPRLTRPLRDGDQLVLAPALLLGLLLLAGYWFSAGGHRGQLVDIDRSPGREIQFQVDLNQADWPELALLPGIGETLARRIVEHRERQGPFARIQDLQQVRGIGPRTVLRLEHYLAPLDSPAAPIRGVATTRTIGH